VAEDECVVGSFEAAADGGTTLAVAVLAELAVSLVDGVEVAEAASALGAGSSLDEVLLGVVAVLASLADSARGCDALGALATVLPASATIAGLSRVAVAIPTSAGGVFDAVVAGCAVVAG
jgi:hypothetical protein